MPTNPEFPTDLRAMPWPNVTAPRNGDAADEVSLDDSARALAERTNTLRQFTTSVENRLLTRFFAPLDDVTDYSARELAQMAQDAASIPAALDQIQQEGLKQLIGVNVVLRGAQLGAVTDAPKGGQLVTLESVQDTSPLAMTAQAAPNGGMLLIIGEE